MARNKDRVPAQDLLDQLDELTAGVYEGDLHALQQSAARGEHRNEVETTTDAEIHAADETDDGQRDFLWPLIR